VKFVVSVVFANLHQAVFANKIGSIGILVFPKGVVFVFAQTGVVGLDCPVVKA
jgi:hypothetical protein